MSRISPVLVAEAFLLKDKEILRLRAEIEKLRLELDMLQATVMVPSQKDDQLRIEHLNAALVAALDDAAKLRAAFNNIEAYVERRVISHRDIAELAESSMSGKKQRVRLSEASDILGKIRAAAALKETE